MPECFNRAFTNGEFNLKRLKPTKENESENIFCCGFNPRARMERDHF